MVENKEPTEKQLSFAKTLGIDEPEQYSRATLSELIDKKAGSRYKKTTEEPKTDTIVKNGYKPRANGLNRYYASYAKDLCIAMLNAIIEKNRLLISKPEDWKDIEVNKIMEAAIHCVKMAKREFE